jgi:AraC-like DNA-binding protein
MRTYLKANTPPSPPGINKIIWQGHAYDLNFFYSGSRKMFFDQYSREGRFVHGEHSHGELYHLVLYVEGDNKFSVNGTRHVSRRGVLALVPPETPHFFVPCQKGSATYAEVAFFFSAKNAIPLRISFEEIFSCYSGIPDLAFASPLILDEELVVFITGKIKDISEQMRSTDQMSYFSAQKSFMDVFAVLIQLICELRQAHVPDSMMRIKAEIEKRYAERLCLKLLAEMAGLSPEYFCRLFKKTYSMSPMAYQQSLRIMSAKYLLRNRDKTCKEISQETGFTGQHFFSRQFKAAVGISPSEFRRKMLDHART